MSKEALRLYKATVKINFQSEEVPVWAEDLDTDLEQAEAEYGEVDRIRPAFTPVAV